MAIAVELVLPDSFHERVVLGRLPVDDVFVYRAPHDLANVRCWVGGHVGGHSCRLLLMGIGIRGGRLRRSTVPTQQQQQTRELGNTMIHALEDASGEEKFPSMRKIHNS